MAIQLYYQPHEKRKKEAAFVQKLIRQWDITDVIPHNFPLPPLPSNINLTTLILQLEQNSPKGKKWPMLLDELKRLPSEVKLFQSISKISCDIVIVKDNKPYFIEYHEKQHHRLSDNRPKQIFSLSNQPLTVPRYVQRFLRDMWRINNLNPLTIVWDNHFQTHGLIDFALVENKQSQHVDCPILCFLKNT